MSNLAFNRKYRSQRFGDLVGQGHVATTLRNAVKNNRVAHAYLFCGPRGVGKTSAARILAKAVNCADPHDGEPCDACESCVSIQEGRAIDINEADAASNRGIEDIRDIRERVGLAPAVARYKMYILDEAHALTNDASNALLKTLEEPPPHAIFVLVTTDPQKLPETIVSRCQRLDFRRITVADATARLAYVCEREEIHPEPGLLELLARTASGSLRDAEGALDQLVAFAGKQPALADARAVLGAAGPDAARRIVAAVVGGEAATALRMVNDLVDQGADPRQIALDVVGCLRDVLLLRTSEHLSDLTEASPEALPDLKALVARLSPGRIVELVRIFQPGPPARGGFRPQLPLEMAVVEADTMLRSSAAIPATERLGDSFQRGHDDARPRSPTSQLLDVIQSAKGAGHAANDTTGSPYHSGMPQAGARPGPQTWVAPQPETPETARPASPVADRPSERPAAEVPEADAPTSTPSSPPLAATGAPGEHPGGILVHEARRRWSDILDLCGGKSRSVQAVLRSGQPVGGEDGTLVLGFPYPFHRERIEDQRNRVLVEEVAGQVLGQKVRIRCVQMSREVLAAADPFQAAMEDPVVKAAIEMGARVRSVDAAEESQ